MRYPAIIFSIIVFALSAGCATYYREASSGDPHAVLKFEAADGLAKVLGGQKILPLEINEQAPNEWTKLTLRSFRLQVGPVRLFLLVHGSQRVQATVYLKFEAVAGDTYMVVGTDNGDSYLVEIRNQKGELVVSGNAPKEAVQNNPAYVPIFIPVK